ncbi:Thiamine-repressible mitochondrial transport protein THI74 [Nakaseomyces bracarensis]|uniref:Thiamine-repressible mitochondrial transport protein THI74 n=1 Tax=Nakaseomyces bracarensis TaxID=273131 RepID=A0ABR4NZC9_9SACH
MFKLGYLGVVVVSWVVSSFITGKVLEQYNRPFLLTYINMSSLVMYLPIYWLMPDTVPVDTKSEDEESLLGEKCDYGSIPSEDEAGSPQEGSDGTNGNIILYCFIFSVLWFAANFFTNSSLLFTSVASQTILSSTSSFFTLVMGCVVGVELFSKRKLVGLCFSFIGVCLVTMSDFHSATGTESSEKSMASTLTGDSFALIGALVYGGYTTLFKHKEKLVSKYNMNLVFGLIGLCTLTTMWPTYFVYQKYINPLETLDFPPSTTILMLILFNCSLSFISNYCWAKSVMLLSSPLVVTMGLTMTIPLAMLGDMIFNHKPFSLHYVFGAFYIIQGFIIIDGFAK